MRRHDFGASIAQGTANVEIGIWGVTTLEVAIGKAATEPLRAGRNRIATDGESSKSF